MPDIVIFGEVLFDRFPDGQSVLGGAPFNVAWHLQGFGLGAMLVSRVGRDAAGDEILSTMQRWGMDTRGMQQDPDRPTGSVEVSLVNGQPSFEILPQQAYDFIEIDPLRSALGVIEKPVLYRGTLAARGRVSRATLDALVKDLQAPVFVDVNLRSPWWTMDEVQSALLAARWAKVNDEELITISERKLSKDDLILEARSFLDRFNLELLILTMGASGACFVSSQGIERGDPVPVSDIKDTVGAGDAFSAVTLLGLHSNWPVPVILQRALEFASRICSQRGATAMDHQLYSDFLQRWQA